MRRRQRCSWLREEHVRCILEIVSNYATFGVYVVRLDHQKQGHSTNMNGSTRVTHALVSDLCQV